MSMSPIEFIQLGIKLLGGGTETHHRTAVSRFYYGVFHTASLILAQQCKIEIPLNEAHAKLPQCLAYSNDPNVAEAGRNLDTLRKMRRIADYELENTIPRSAQWAQQQLLLTQKIVQVLETWAEKADFPEASLGVRKYAQEVLKLNVLD